jgi:hypothetical protein
MNIENDTKAERAKKTARERFFAIDAQTWPKVCVLGMPAAVSYLVLACGSGGDQTTTRWSVDAITRHTGIGRPRAKKAVDALVKTGLIRIDRAGTRPQYSIIHAHQQRETVPDLTSEEQRIYGIISQGNNAVPKIGRHDNVWKYGKPYEAALSLTRKGFLKDLGGHRFTLAEQGTVPEGPELIWLPCSLVDSEGKNLTPVEQIRQSNNVRVLRLFIDLYHSHDLINGLGIEWRPPTGLRHKYERIKLGQMGEHVVWGFKPLTSHVYFAARFCAPHVDHAKTEHQAQAFFDALQVLTDLHLVDVIPHLVDNYSEHGEEMWPIPMKGEGEECERLVGLTAAKLANLMLTTGQIDWANSQGIEMACPVKKHMADVQAVGIYRLRHRPHTEATKAWFSELNEQCSALAERFNELIAEFDSNATLSKNATSR